MDEENAAKSLPVLVKKKKRKTKSKRKSKEHVVGEEEILFGNNETMEGIDEYLPTRTMNAEERARHRVPKRKTKGGKEDSDILMEGRTEVWADDYNAGNEWFEANDGMDNDTT